MNTRSLGWVHDTLVDTGLLRVASGITGGARPWRGASVDSREDVGGKLFFAIKGDRTDGHRFVRDAFAAGAIAAIIEDQEMSTSLAADGVAHLVVDDSRRALLHLAGALRRATGVRTIAVTGSAGKTTTKEYVRAVLRARYRVHANRGNLNSLIGVPLTVLDMDDEAEYLVCEVGANLPGEVYTLSELLQPEVGVITNIGDAHIGLFGSREGIIRAKGELLDHVLAVSVLPGDDAALPDLRQRARGRVVTFGAGPGADFRFGNVERGPEGIRFEVNEVPVAVEALFDHAAANAAAAIAVGDICGVDINVAARALADVPATPGRGHVHRLRGVVLIDESYNASPASMKRSLTQLAGQSGKRRIACLGDMKELGDYTRELHEATGRHIATLDIDCVHWLGADGEHVQAGMAGGKQGVDFRQHQTVEEMIGRVVGSLRAGDVVLVRGSRACQLDQLVDAVVTAFVPNAEQER